MTCTVHSAADQCVTLAPADPSPLIGECPLYYTGGRVRVLYSAHCTLQLVSCTVYTVLYNWCIVQCPLYSTVCVVYTAHFTLQLVYCTVPTVLYSWCIVQCSLYWKIWLYSAHCTGHTVQGVWCIVECTVHYLLFGVQSLVCCVLSV